MQLRHPYEDQTSQIAQQPAAFIVKVCAAKSDHSFLCLNESWSVFKFWIPKDLWKLNTHCEWISYCISRDIEFFPVIFNQEKAPLCSTCKWSVKKEIYFLANNWVSFLKKIQNKRKSLRNELGSTNWIKSFYSSTAFPPSGSPAATDDNPAGSTVFPMARSLPWAHVSSLAAEDSFATKPKVLEHAMFSSSAVPQASLDSMSNVYHSPPVTPLPFIASAQRLSIKDAVKVFCEIEKIVIAIQKKFLQQESIPESSLYLGEPHCNVSFSNDTSVVLQTGWNECGAEVQSVSHLSGWIWRNIQVQYVCVPTEGSRRYWTTVCSGAVSSCQRFLLWWTKNSALLAQWKVILKPRWEVNGREMLLSPMHPEFWPASHATLGYKSP